MEQQAIKQKNVQELYKLPSEVKFCTRCVISNQRPRISFDDEGVCSACRAVERKNKINWQEREKELVQLCDEYRSKDGSFDVVVPCSGGKDSASVAHKLKYKYGMNPLAVTWAPHLYTDIGSVNLQNFSRIGGVDNILGTPDGILHRKMSKLAFIDLGDPFQPFIYGQIAFPLQIAAKFNIKLIMYGEDTEAEYGGEIKEIRKTRGYDYLQHSFSGRSADMWAEYGINQNDVRFYLPPSTDELESKGIKCYFLGYYLKWTPQENYYYVVNNTGFKANPERSEGTYSKYASLDDKIDGFHYYLGFIKFGLGRTTSDASHEIRDNHLTREEGVALVRKFDGEFPKKYFKEFLEYCDITEELFWEVVDSWRSSHLWKKVDNEWKLRYQVS